MFRRLVSILIKAAQYADSTSYVGQWKDNKRDGHGVSVLTGGISYDGEVGLWHCCAQNFKNPITEAVCA